jgi:hypothetical protein
MTAPPHLTASGSAFFSQRVDIAWFSVLSGPGTVRAIGQADRGPHSFSGIAQKEDVMSQHSASQAGCHPVHRRIAVLIFTVAMAGGLSINANARDGTSAAAAAKTAAPAQNAGDLEKTFWVCDYLGTTGSVDGATAVACVTATEQFKNSRFNGDFDALLVWWREHKPAMHQALEAASRASGGLASAVLPRR